MNARKKTVCFIGQNERTCVFVSNQLLHFLKDYIDVKTWCLQYMNTPPDYQTSDIYLASSHTVLDKVSTFLPQDKKILVAARTINIENLDKLLELEPGTRALVVGSSQETSELSIKIIESFGINYLDLIPYYPGTSQKIPLEIKLAITTGQAHLVPNYIETIVDLGVKGIDLSTYVELAQHLDNIPMEVLNEISHYYIEAIMNLSLKQQKVARLNETLKRKIEVILNTVDEAIVAVNETNEIVVFNPAAERLLEINAIQAMGQNLKNIIPEVNFTACLKNGESILHDIKRINDNYYIVSANPTTDEIGLVNGVVATFRPVGEVQELETMVRRELKKKGNIAKHTFSEIVGQSEEIKEAIALAKQFAKTELTVLLEGESGTGKELFAQAIHNYSHRKNGPFVALNFAALPENLVESELFGYEEGAFTGARKGGKQGLFEQAHLGTIFLDEIGDSSLEMQKKLLRVLEEREVRRVGGSTVTPVDVRVIAATNQDLESLVKQGKFRSDLFYRLCTLPIYIPPLRARSGDIFLLINYLARKLYNRELSLEPPLREFLSHYQWPGNIRELQNVVKYMCSVVGPQEAATIKHLPAYLVRNSSLGPISYLDTSRPTNENKFAVLVQELRNQNALEPITLILSELRKATSLGKGLGRQTLLLRLQALNNNYPDHKIRQWLKMLAELGYVDSGTTRQGSRTTKLGEELLAYIESNLPSSHRKGKAVDCG